MFRSIRAIRLIRNFAMRIAGLQKTTLVDFPGIVAATVFTPGCSFRCGFCHNPELVLQEQFQGNIIPNEDFFNFLVSRVGKLQGVCITGGEPLLQPDIDSFISHIKALGFKVKLDTNGSFPDRLEKIIKEGDIDYIAMDVKSPLGKYAEITNHKSQNSNFQLKTEKPKKIKKTKKQFCNLTISQTVKNERAATIKQSNNDLKEDIIKSIDLIMSSNIDYEFRTTVCHPYHEVKDFEQIGKMIKGAKRYFIQNFVKSKHINKNLNFKPFTDEELKKSVEGIDKFVKKVDIR